jgi:DNA-binding winged helix-turn-helix (wHTH) protein
LESDVTGYRVGDLTVELHRERVLRGDAVIVLPKLSFDLLLALVKAAPTIVTVDTLLDQVWTGLVVSPETVTQRIKLLRGALGDDSQNPRYIEGIRGRGYRVIADVQILNADLIMKNGTKNVATEAPPEISRATPWHRSSHRWMIAAVLLLVLFAATFLQIHSETNVSQPDGSTNPIAQDYYLKALQAREAAVNILTSAQTLRIVEGLLNQAIALDPEFAAAYAERSMIRFALFFTNLEITQQQLDLAQADLIMANKVDPAHPKVMALNGFKLSHIDRNFADAIELLEHAVAAGMNEPVWLALYADLLIGAGRMQAAETIVQSAMMLDYENPLLQQTYLILLVSSRQYERAFQTLAFYRQASPDDPFWQSMYVMTVAYLTGDLEPWRAMAERARTLVNAPADNPEQLPFDSEQMLYAQFEWLLLDHRYSELLQLIEQHPAAILRPQFITTGLQPKASLAGWVHLLMGDRDSAAQSGAEITRFLANQEEFSSHYVFRTFLAAEAALFQGDMDQAVALTDTLDRELLPNVGFRLWLPVLYAWAEADDKAMAMLTLMSGGDAGAPPGRLTLDPLLTTPLVDNKDYQALKTRLEQEMRLLHETTMLQ